LFLILLEQKRGIVRKKIIILGAGFAGLQLARGLTHSDYEVVLIDQYNFHQFQPLFYQVATARLEPSAISFPLRKVFQRMQHVHVRIAAVKQVDLLRKVVMAGDEAFFYD
jgi:NADH dehydrogenase